MSIQSFDVVILGAGAAGLMCAIEAGKRHRRVLIIERSNKPGKKILMSGGGRCNFTNLYTKHDRYISENPHFCKSALSRYTPWDFIEWVKKHHIPYHEKKLGQLFCDHKAKDLLLALLKECDMYGVTLHLNETVTTIKKNHDSFFINTDRSQYQTNSLVIATGGLSIPTLGSSDFGYQVARQFGIFVQPTRPGLVPLTFATSDLERFAPLAGISCPARVRTGKIAFEENILITHKGLSGPAILQISNYWKDKTPIRIDLVPDQNVAVLLKHASQKNPNTTLKIILSQLISKRLLLALFDTPYLGSPIHSIPHSTYDALAKIAHQWELYPIDTEGYRTAEVTLGGVDCNAISSKTMECNTVKGLYFIGEVLDVTGWLGGYNFQWAWSSGWAAGQTV